MGTHVIAGFLELKVSNVSLLVTGEDVPRRIVLAARSELGLEREEISDLTGGIVSEKVQPLVNNKDAYYSRFLLSSRNLPTSLRSMRTSVAKERLNSSKYCS